MTFKIKCAAVSVAVFIITATVAFAIPAKPSPPKLVNDFAGIIDEQSEYILERILTDFSDSTSNQITVVTVNSLEGYDPSRYAVEIGNSWGVGGSDFNNGIVVLVKPKNQEGPGRVNISVGYGLEGAIPDAYAKRIIESEMIPFFRTDDYVSGIARACKTLMRLASGEISISGNENGKTEEIIGLVSVLIFLFLIIFLSSLFNRGG